MNTTIEIKISNLGEAEGTLGWLLHQPIKIHIGNGKQSKQPACWLHIGEKSQMVATYGFICEPEVGYLPAPGEIRDTTVDRNTLDRYGYGVTESVAFGVSFTTAAWVRVEELIAMARAQFRLAVDHLKDSENALSNQSRFEISQVSL